MVNLITHPAWSQSALLIGTEAGELTRRGLVRGNSLHARGYNLY
jgi:hypothetical protein